MPTGYTAAIKDGIDFKTFAMNCARAFGACVTLRDEPGGGEHIPEAFEPSDYHIKAMLKARGELSALSKMTTEECEQAALQEWYCAEENRLERLHEIRQQRKAYEEMLNKVDAWKPPTPDHFELRGVMRQQIESSINFDCSEDYYSSPSVKMDGASWAEARREKLLRDVQYHEKSHSEEVRRAADRTAWVQALRASL